MGATYSKVELQIIDIYIGCKIRLERLRKNLSQYDVGINSGTDNTAVGRIERAEHSSSWSKIYLVCQSLNIDFTELFVLKQKEELMALVDKIHSMERKLTNEKEKYYEDLKKRIENLFRILGSVK